jgi:hypothetical protein
MPLAAGKVDAYAEYCFQLFKCFGIEDKVMEVIKDRSPRVTVSEHIAYYIAFQ